MATFGEFLKRRRKELALTQATVAGRIIQDGKPLSMQYLNDIENGRRGAPPDYVLKQLSKVLRLEFDLLYFRAGRISPDLQRRVVSDARAVAAISALRAALRPRQKKLKNIFATLSCADLHASALTHFMLRYTR